MSNYKLHLLLDASPLSAETRYNIETIFRVLTDEQQIRILDNWESYLNKLLYVQTQETESRKQLVAWTMQQIDSAINEAYARDQEKKREEIERKKREEADAEAAREYDRIRKNQVIAREEIEKAEIRKKLADPLSFL